MANDNLIISSKYFQQDIDLYELIEKFVSMEKVKKVLNI